MLIGNYFKKIENKYKNYFFSGLSFKSSECKRNDIFFAIKGNKNNGNQYVDEAIKKGAKIIISERKFQGVKKNILYLKSKNVRKLLAELSYKIFKDRPNNLIAVTGTNGKSSVADFYFQILSLNKKKVASIGTLGIKTSYNTKPVINTTLDPITLASELSDLKKKKINNVILEASSHGLKQNRLNGLNFKSAVFTNLSHDHLDYHKNFKDYLNSKMYLFENLMKKGGNIITDINIPQFRILKKISKKKKLNLDTIFNYKSNLAIASHKYLGEGQLLSVRSKNIKYSFQLNLIGKIQIQNFLMAVIAAEKSNLDIKKIINIAHMIKPVKGRLEKIGKIKNKSCVILDYAHTPDALDACLQNINDQFKNKKISIVFGCGGDRDKLKRSKMGKVADKYCHKIYLTDDNPRNENPGTIRLQIKKGIKKSRTIEISSREEAIKRSIFNLKTGEVLVVAGKGHENIQDYGNTKNFFSDKKHILRNILIKNRGLSKNIKLNILKEESKSNKLLSNYKINKAKINSKAVKKNDIFFAIKGSKQDGNLFLKEVFKKKASLAFVNKINKKEKKNQQIKIKNTLDFLSNTSTLIRENSLAKIVAITGSCGKTSLKELLANTFKKFSNVMYSPKSYNNKFGVPLSLFNLEQYHDYGVFEVGMDRKGEIDSLSKIIKPDIAVITNISYAHIKNFKNIRQIALAKSEIISNIKKGGSLVLNADDKFFKLHRKIAIQKKIKVYSFSLKKDGTNINLKGIKKLGKKFIINIKINEKEKSFIVSSNFENYIKNILAAITVISIFKKENYIDRNIFDDFKMPSGRGDISRIKIGKKSIFLIDESYNSNPLSVKSAIENFNDIDIQNNKKHLILGDMLELGTHSKKLHLGLSSLINSSSIDSVNVIGKYIKETYKNIYQHKKGLILQESSQIINLIKDNINNNDYLMIKGSNSTGLNKFTNHLKLGKKNAV